MCDAAVQTDAIVTARVDVGTDAIVTSRVDVGTDAVLPQPRRDASAQTDAKSKTRRHVTISDLPLMLVEGVLQHLDCITLFRARRGERHWPRPVSCCRTGCWGA